MGQVSNKKTIQMISHQTKSKRRIADYSEVYTSAHEVNAMINLVKQEIEQIKSRFLETACGNGNFFIEIIACRLAIISSRYSESHHEYERYAVSAISSLYGIDILEDNVIERRNRLYDYFSNQCVNLFGVFPDEVFPQKNQGA